MLFESFEGCLFLKLVNFIRLSSFIVCLMCLVLGIEGVMILSGRIMFCKMVCYFSIIGFWNVILIVLCGDLMGLFCRIILFLLGCIRLVISWVRVDLL